MNHCVAAAIFYLHAPDETMDFKLSRLRSIKKAKESFLARINYSTLSRIVFHFDLDCESMHEGRLPVKPYAL